VALGVKPIYVLTPAVFSRWVKGALPYPHHWL
jgi:hypothetical protein